MKLPASFDHETRGIWWGYIGETFQVCRASGMSPDEARQFALDFTHEQIRNYQLREASK